MGEQTTVDASVHPSSKEKKVDDYVETMMQTFNQSLDMDRHIVGHWKPRQQRHPPKSNLEGSDSSLSDVDRHQHTTHYSRRTPYNNNNHKSHNASFESSLGDSFFGDSFALGGDHSFACQSPTKQAARQQFLSMADDSVDFEMDQQFQNLKLQKPDLLTTLIYLEEDEEADDHNKSTSEIDRENPSSS